MYCNTLVCIARKKAEFVLQGWIVLQPKGKLCCRVVLQEAGSREKLCRNTVHCIVTEAGQGLYCNTVTGPQLGARLGVLGAGVGWSAQGDGRAVPQAAWALGGTGAAARGVGARGRAAAGWTSGCAGVQGRAGCAATRPGGSAMTRPRARGLCAQAGPAGPGWGFVHSDSVFGPGSARYFPESPNEHCSL